jgi:hypothetical protein
MLLIRQIYKTNDESLRRQFDEFESASCWRAHIIERHSPDPIYPHPRLLHQMF